MNHQLLRLIDSHVHLDEINDLEIAIDQAKAVGIMAFLAVGQDYQSNQQVLDICTRHSGLIFPALGLHPWHLGGMDSVEIDHNLRFIEDHIDIAVGVGEIGLDYHKRVRAVAGKELQKEVFSALLSLAKRYNKPVSVHSRYAWKDCFDLVKESGVTKAVFHWFTGFSSTLGDIIDAGYFISVTPAVEYHEEHRRAIKETPLTRLLLETDAPVRYGMAIKYESRPSDIIRALGTAAQLKGVDKETAAEQTTDNAMRLFGLTFIAGRT